MTVLDAPVMPVPNRLTVTGISGSCCCACAALCSNNRLPAASATPFPVQRLTQRMPAPFRSAPPQWRRVTMDAKDAREFSRTAQAHFGRDRRACIIGKSREGSHAAFASVLCHRCEQPLRVDAPPTGWVTVLAGLLARGSLSASSLPGFPVANLGRGL